MSFKSYINYITESIVDQYKSVRAAARAGDELMRQTHGQAWPQAMALHSYIDGRQPPTITTTRYGNGETGVHSAMHTDARTGSAYWGYSISDKEGKSTDTPPKGVSSELRTARSRTAMGHLVDFAKRNPKTPITYMTNPGKQGEKNHQFFQKRWAELQKTHGLNNTLTRVEKNPFRK